MKERNYSAVIERLQISKLIEGDFKSAWEAYSEKIKELAEKAGENWAANEALLSELAVFYPSRSADERQGKACADIIIAQFLRYTNAREDDLILLAFKQGFMAGVLKVVSQVRDKVSV